jgi:aspartyl protease family protein
MRPFLLAMACLLAASSANATDIGLLGVFPGKAILAIDDKSPKMFEAGNTLAEGVKLVSISDSSVTIDENGKRRTVPLGGYMAHKPAGPSTVTLQADGQGHFVASGQINGHSMRLLVDTGATMVALPASEAERLGIDYKNGQTGFISTANGRVAVHRVKLDNIKIGDIELTQIDATIHDSGLPIALLGMSFLNRTEMHRNGEQMTLTKRY